MIAEPAWEEPAPFVDALVGWRAWHLRRTAGGPALVPAASGRGEWPARRAYVATCRRSGVVATGRGDLSGHASPSLHCTCGIYASDTLRSLIDPRQRFPPLPVLGTVSLWGHAIEHGRGWRAELGYPDRIRLVCGRCLSAGTGPGIPERVVEIRGQTVGGPPQIEPLCAQHLAERNRAGTRILKRAVDVQAELLSRYAVDLLPFEAIQSVFQRTPIPGPRAGSAGPGSPSPLRPAPPAQRVPGPIPGADAVTPSAPIAAPTPSTAPRRTRVVDVVQKIVNGALTVALWVFVAWWGCSDMIVTTEGP